MVKSCRALSISWLSSVLSAFMRELLSSTMEGTMFKFILSPRKSDEARSVNAESCVAVFRYRVNVSGLKGTLKGLLEIVLEHKYQYCGHHSAVI